jgi:hypothetical protein
MGGVGGHHGLGRGGAGGKSVTGPSMTQMYCHHPFHLLE